MAEVQVIPPKAARPDTLRVAAYGKSCEADAVRLACSEPEGQSGIPETSI